MNKILQLQLLQTSDDTKIFLPPSQQRFPNLANKSLCYNVMTISLFVSAAQGGAPLPHIGAEQREPWPGLMSPPIRCEAGHSAMAAVNHNPAST